MCGTSRIGELVGPGMLKSFGLHRINYRERLSAKFEQRCTNHMSINKVSRPFFFFRALCRDANRKGSNTAL